MIYHQIFTTMVQSDVSCSPIDVLQQQLIAMRQHHFGTGFRGQALAVQEGAIPENCGRIQSAKKLAAHRLACKKTHAFNRFNHKVRSVGKDLDLTIERLALGDLMDELVSIKSFGIWASRMGSSSIGSGIY
jgi:hypothetical protein